MSSDTQLDLVIKDFEEAHKLSQRSHRILFGIDMPSSCDSSPPAEAENPNCFSGLLKCNTTALLNEEMSKAGCIDIKEVSNYTLEAGPIGVESSAKPFTTFYDTSDKNFCAISALTQTLFASTHFRNIIYNFVAMGRDKNSSFEECGHSSLKLIKELCKAFIDMEFSLKVSTSLEGLTEALDGELLPKMKVSSLYEGIIEALSKGFSLFEASNHIKTCTEFEVAAETRCINCEDVRIETQNNFHFFSLPMDRTERATAVHIFDDLLKPLFPREYVEDECMKCYDGVLERAALLKNAPPILTLKLPGPSSERYYRSFIVPLEADFGEFMSSSDGHETSYEVLSVICRVCGGDDERDHYVTYTRKFDKWWCFDSDSPVTECDINSLPFHLADINGNLLTPNNKDLVYNYSSKTFVGSSVFEEGPVLIPCMAFYQRKDVSNEESKCPKELSKNVIEESFRLFQAHKEDPEDADKEPKGTRIQKRVMAHVDAYEKLAKTFSQIAPGEKYYWIPREWIERLMNSTYLSSDTEGEREGNKPMTIDLAPYACGHGLLDIKHVRSMKRISSSAWDFISARFGVKEGSPVFDNTSECDLCAGILIEQMIEMRRRRAVKGEFDSENMILNRPETFGGIPSNVGFYFVSTDFYKEFECLEELPLALNTHPTKDITCVHGNMKFGSKSKKLKKVSVNTWDWIASQFSEKPTAFKRGTTMCPECKKENETIALEKEKLKDCLIPRYTNFEKSVNKGVLYFLVSREWYFSVRNFACFARSGEIQPFDFSKVLCPHGKVPYNLEIEFLADGSLAYISETEWKHLNKM